MTRFLMSLALRRAAAEWQLLSGLAFGTVVAVALLAAAPIYLRALDDLGIQSTFRAENPSDLDIHIRAAGLRLDNGDYSDVNQRVQSAVAASASRFTQGSQRSVRSATLYVTTAGETPRTDTDRPRSYIQVIDGLQDHARVIAGRLPERPSSAGAPRLEVVVPQALAAKLRIDLGDEFSFAAFWLNDATIPVTASVVGIVAPDDPGERFWSGTDYFTPPDTTWDTFVFFAREDAFIATLGRNVEGLQVDATWAFLFDTGTINGGNVDEARAAMQDVVNSVRQRVPNAELQSRVGPVLESYQHRLTFARVPLFVLLAQVELIVLFYVVLVASMVVERQSGEIAVFKSRGAGQRQLFVVYLLQALFIAAIALVLGPLIAGAGIALLGLTPAFSDLSNGSLLTITIGRTAILLAIAGAALSVVALLLPAFRAARVSIVQHRQAAARQHRTSGLRHYYLDAVLIAGGAFLFWRSQQQTLVTLGREGDLVSDPLLLMAPAVFSMTAALIFLRLFPVALAGVAKVVAPFRNPSAPLALTYMVRSPAHYARLIFLLILATSLGIFSASFGATLDRSYQDRSLYLVGSNVRYDFAAAEPTRDITSVATTAARSQGALAAAAAMRMPARLADGQGDTPLELLAVEPHTFAETAWFRPDFADDDEAELVGRLASDPRDAGVRLPADSDEFGVWVRLPDARAGTSILARALDANGQYFDYVLGMTASSEPVFATEEADGLAMWGARGQVVASGDALAGWTYLSTSVTDLLDPSRALGLGSRNFDTPASPIQLVSLYFQQRLGPDEQPGATVVVDSLSVTHRNGKTEVIDGFEEAGQWETLPAGTTSDAPDIFSITQDNPQEGSSAAVYSWTTPGLDTLHGIRAGGAEAGLPVLVNRALLERTNRDVGDTLGVSVGTHQFEARIAGVFDLFPTYSPDAGDLVVADLEATRRELNRVPGSGGIRAVSEVWVRTETGVGADRLDLPAGSRPSSVLEALQERERLRLDPLIETGWQGVLLIAFVTIAVLSSLGMLIYAYLAAQARRLDFAVLRTMGLSPSQIFGLVGLEQLLVVGLGMLGGSLIGSRISVLILGSLELTETGDRVTPPFVLEVNWPAVAAAYGLIVFVFALSVLFLVLFFSRLSLHRMLRIGDS